MRLVVGQRLWRSDGQSNQGQHPVHVVSVSRVLAILSDGAKVDADYSGVRVSKVRDPDHYYTDTQQEERVNRARKWALHAEIQVILNRASVETLNKIAAALDLPEVVAWTPENPT